MEDIKLEHFLEIEMHDSDPQPVKEEPRTPKTKLKSPKAESKKKTKRKRNASEGEINGDIFNQDPDKSTINYYNENHMNDESHLNDDSFMIGWNQTFNKIHAIAEKHINNQAEDGHGKFQQYNKDKQWKLAKIPHHFLPSFNLTKFTDLKNLRDYPLLRTSLPHSVYASSLHLNKVDICHRRTLALSAYTYRIKALQTAYFTAKRKSKLVRKEEKKGIYDKTLVDFIVCRDNHPDKFFERDYDFYYTGGNLCVNNRRDHVLHTSGNNMDNLNLSKFKVTDKPTLHTLGSVNLAETHEDESEVFEIQFSNIGHDVFFLRRKHTVSMIEHKNDTFNALNTLQSNVVPIISFSQCNVDSNQLAITNLHHQVRLYDVENSVVVQKYKLVPRKDITPATNWNMIRSWDRSVYLYAACRKIHFIDTRMPQDEWQSNYCGFDEDNPCSTFCSLAVSNFDGLFYVGSNHKAYCIDHRYTDRNVESKNTAVSRWTHQMTSCPLMMAVNRHGDNEYLVLQSPQSADLRICENMRFLEEPDSEDVVSKKLRTELPPEYNYTAPCLPYMPETLENIFREARKSGACIRPDIGIANRIKACNTGLSFVGPSSNPYILTATSNGDVFARHMFNPDDSDDFFRDEASAVDVMSEYEASISKSVTHPRLSVTEVCDFSGINKVFRCSAFSDTKPDDDVTGVPKRRYMGRWQKSFKRLCKFKDALVTDLLAIWDIEEPEEKNVNLTDIFQDTKSDSKSLVSSWLNSTQGIKSSTMLNMTSIPFDSFNESTAGFEALCEATQNGDAKEEFGDTSVIAKPKVSKKKNRYVKGF